MSFHKQKAVSVKYVAKSYSPAVFSLVPLASFSVSLLPFSSVPFLVCYKMSICRQS